MSVAHQLLFWKILLMHSAKKRKKKENRPFHKIPSPNGHCPIILPSNWYYVNKILYIFLQFIKSVVKVLGNRCIKMTCFRPYSIFNVSIPEYVKALYRRGNTECRSVCGNSQTVNHWLPLTNRTNQRKRNEEMVCLSVWGPSPSNICGLWNEGVM